MKLAAIFTCSLVLAGCASMGADPCRSANWYALGHRDGLEGGHSQISEYTAQCSAHRVKPDSARYEQGVLEGLRERRSNRRF